MIQKRKLLVLSIIVLVTFVLVTHYLLSTLTQAQSEVRSRNIQGEILKHLGHLPQKYRTTPQWSNEIVDSFIRDNDEDEPSTNVTTLWQIANSWVSKHGVVDFSNGNLANVLVAMKQTRIIKADLDTRGTQLKLLLTLQGGQDVIFKPKWYSKDRVIEGPVYAGKDRYFSEIIAFYLSLLLNMPFTPCSAERIVSLSNEVLPVATQRLVDTSFNIGNRTCVYGKCHYCSKADPICEDFDNGLYGVVIFNMHVQLKPYRSPWQRTYKKGKSAAWEEDDNFCQGVKKRLQRKRLLDLIDASVFDFLIQNGDRHHYETLEDNVILLDNGKGFGNPNVHHLDILAPLYQCCRLRNRTYDNLVKLSGGNLRGKLSEMPDVRNVISDVHLDRLEERLLIVFATLEYCKTRNKKYLF